MWDSYFMKLKNKVATSKRFDTPLKKNKKAFMAHYTEKSTF